MQYRHRKVEWPDLYLERRHVSSLPPISSLTLPPYPSLLSAGPCRVVQSNILGDYDPTSMSAHFPADLECISGFEDDLFAFSSMGQDGAQARSAGGSAGGSGSGSGSGGGPEATSSSFGGYAGQTHAYQAYADASFVPLTGLPEARASKTQRSGGYSSSEYHEAVAGLPGFLDTPKTTFLQDGPEKNVFGSSAAGPSQARQTIGGAQNSAVASSSAMFEGAPSVVYSMGAGDAGNGNGNGNGNGVGVGVGVGVVSVGVSNWFPSVHVLTMYAAYASGQLAVKLAPAPPAKYCLVRHNFNQ